MKKYINLVDKAFKTILNVKSVQDKLYFFSTNQSLENALYKREKDNFFIGFAKVVLILVLFTFVGFIFEYIGLSDINIVMAYLLGVLVTAIATANRIQSTISAVLSIILYNFFFIEPKFTFQVSDSDYTVTFIVMFIVAVISSTLTVMIRTQTEQSLDIAYRTKILFETNQLLQNEKTVDDIFIQTAKQLRKLLSRTIIIYTSQDGEIMPPQVFPYKENYIDKYTTESEKLAANWCYENKISSGAYTATYKKCKSTYTPISTSTNTYGVVGIVSNGNALDSFEYDIIMSIIGECSLALEKELYNRKREEATALAKNEKLRSNLLRSISHDLRTPLTSISGNSEMLLNNGKYLSDGKKEQLYIDIYDESMWLINLVENLLSITRMENREQSVVINTQLEIIDELIDEALCHINRRKSGHNIKVIKNDEIMLVKVDSRLIVQVIINLVDNAIKYTPPGSEITINSYKKDSMVYVEIADNGNGIPDDSKEKIFNMFYTIDKTVSDSRRSIGLGLALCKSIITTHGGTISLKDNSPSGAIFCFTLQSEEVALHE